MRALNLRLRSTFEICFSFFVFVYTFLIDIINIICNKDVAYIYMYMVCGWLCGCELNLSFSYKCIL